MAQGIYNTTADYRRALDAAQAQAQTLGGLVSLLPRRITAVNRTARRVYTFEQLEVLPRQLGFPDELKLVMYDSPWTYGSGRPPFVVPRPDEGYRLSRGVVSWVMDKQYIGTVVRQRTGQRRLVIQGYRGVRGVNANRQRRQVFWIDIQSPAGRLISGASADPAAWPWTFAVSLEEEWRRDYERAGRVPQRVTAIFVGDNRLQDARVASRRRTQLRRMGLPPFTQTPPATPVRSAILPPPPLMTPADFSVPPGTPRFPGFPPPPAQPNFNT